MNIELPPPSALKKASQPVSFYQQCYHLVQVIWSLSNHHEINQNMENGYNFSRDLFPLGIEHDSNFVGFDPVTVLWDFCSLGSPLCALMNLFKESQKIKIIEIDKDCPLEITMKKRQKSVFLFIKSCKDTLKMTDAELFTISDVFRDDTNYFIKVVKTLNKVVEKLKEKEGLPKELIPFPESLGLIEYNDDSTDYRAKQIKELLETERSYVRDLELMRTYKNEAEYKRIITKDKSLRLFANIDDLVDFQRRFLIGLESTLALPVNEQMIGYLFSTNEANFSVYDTYCANQESAVELVVSEGDYYTESWSRVYNKFNNLPEDTPVSQNNQISSYLIRPVQRICKYPLLLERLYKDDKKNNHPHAQELYEGLEAIKRVVNRTNETKRRDENSKKVRELSALVSSGIVENWKNLQIDQFGELLLMDQFDVSTMDGGEKVLDFYLFERILLSFKEGKPKKSRVDSNKKPIVPLILKHSIFTTFITDVEDISIPNQMKFQFKIELRTGDGFTSVILKTKKGLDLVQKWVDQFADLKKKRNQKQSAFNNNTQLISSYNINLAYAQQFQNDSSDDEYTEEQLNMRPNVVPLMQSNSYTSTLSNQNSVPFRSSSFSRNDSQEINSNLSHSYSSTSSSYYGAGNEQRNPQYDIYSNNNYYDDSFLDDYFGYDSDPDNEYRRGSVSSSSYSQYYSGGYNQQYHQQYPSNSQNYYSHSRSNSNQYSSQSSRNSSYPDMPTPNIVPPPTLPNENKMSNGQYIHQRNLSNPPSMMQAPITPQRRERSLSRGSRTPVPMKPSASAGNIHGITNSMNNMNIGNGISQSYSLNQITPPVTPIQHTSHSTPMLAQVPPIAQNSNGSVNGQHKAFLPGLALGSTAKLKTHFKDDIFTLAVPSTSISYEDLRRKIEKKLSLCGHITEDFDFSKLEIHYKGDDGQLVSIKNDDDIIKAYVNAYRDCVGKRGSGTMVIEIFVV